MATSVNNGVSEERFRKPLMENGDSNALARSRYKRRKISAIRDFPDGCGPLASRIDPVSKVYIADSNGTIAEDKNAEHLGGDAVRTSSNGRIVDDKNAERLGGDAVRTSSDGTIVDDKNAERLGDGADRTSKCEDDLRHSELKKESFLTATLSQTVDCSLKEENTLVTSNQADGPTLANDEPAQGPLVTMESLDTERARNVNSVQCDSPNMSKSSSEVGGAAISGGSKSLSPKVNIDGSKSFMEESVTRRYLPRRKISAVRDFPHLCGRNAPRLSKDEYLEGTSLNNKREGQQNMTVDDNPLKNVTATDAKEVENNVRDEYGCKRKLVDIVPADSEGNATKKVKQLNPLENTREKYNELPEKSNHGKVKITFKAPVKEENRDGIQIEGESGIDIIDHPEVQSLETKPLNMSASQHKLKRDGSEVASDREVVLGLMSKSECPWKSDDGSSKIGSTKVKLVSGSNESKGKKMDYSARLQSSKTAIKTKGAVNHSELKPLKKKNGNAVSYGKGQLVIQEKKNSLDPNKNVEDFQVVKKLRHLNVDVPPVLHPDFSGHGNDSNVTRVKVRESLRLFQAVSRKLLQEVEAKLDERANKRIDLQAAKIIKEKGKYVNTGKPILGIVPGVEVGDEFQYRVELNIIGLHRPIQGGIDYVKHNGKVLATSIVASGGYADELDNSDVLIYTGQGGNVMNSDKVPEDQKLERGNLALKNSSEEKNPVRVIRGTESTDGKCSRTYVYDGLYLVESCWQDMGPHGKLVYKFRLRRIPGQPELALKEVKKSKKFKTREGLCVNDISYGKERIPICAVNTIDDGKPPPFEYITSMIYPDCDLIPQEGCDCNNGCSDSDRCSCVVKNGERSHSIITALL